MSLSKHALTKKAHRNELLGVAECRRWESNPHARRHTSLSRARLPIPPLRPVSIILSNPHSQVKQQKVRAMHRRDQGNRKVKHSYYLNDLHIVNTPSRPPGTLILKHHQGASGECSLYEKRVPLPRGAHFRFASGVFLRSRSGMGSVNSITTRLQTFLPLCDCPAAGTLTTGINWV